MAASGYTPILIYASGTASNVPSAANLTSSASGAELALNYTDGKLYFKNNSGVVTLLASAAGASGDVVGPASATDNAVARFDLTTGKLIQNSVVIIGDTGDVTGVGALSASGNVTLSGGTANGVTYLNGSKVLTSGAALTFDGTSAQIGDSLSSADGSRFYVYANTPASTSYGIKIGGNANSYTQQAIRFYDTYFGAYAGFLGFTTNSLTFGQGTTEGMRLTSTGLGIGTSSPGQKLEVAGNILINTSGNPTMTVKTSGAGNNPGYLLTADTNTWGIYGIFSDANDTLQYQYNGNTRLTLTNDGNLGIGTSSPSYKLTVVTPTSDATIGFNLRAYATGADGARTVNSRYTSSNDGNWAVSTYQAWSHLWYTNGTNTLTLDSSGNLGLGVTPSAWATITPMQIKNASYSGYANEAIMSANTYYNAGWKYIATDGASRYSQGSGAHYWFTAPSGTAGNAISFTQAMTLDDTGKLLVGGTTGTAGGKLTVTTANAGYVAVEPTSSVTNQIATGLRLHGNINETDRYVGIFCYNGAANNVNSMTFWTSSSGSSAERMRIDNVGNVGIGTTSPAARLDLGTPGNVRFINAENGVDANFRATFSSNTVTFANTGGSGVLAFQTGGTERARITSGGNFLVGATAVPSASVAGFCATGTSSGNFTSSGSSTAAYNHWLFYNGNGIVGSISTSGSTTTYSTSSDHRLKENIQPMTGALAKVAQLKPCTYNWKADGSAGEGFIAHELAEVVSQCVTGEKDAVDAEGKPIYQGIDTSFLVATLTAAIQELKAEFDAYKASHP